ncbi:hypothetical protein Phpb_00285 [Photorhabdus namnaonensis]|uniref:Uncharacterized protein n=1 Tax=Photorhabdus namnaonensis TaxID=1851568 RepID=A0A1B8YN27_9GAMM|nr:hypothetical protein Phpb_00285 [Photorhabdus namnaonensis]
MASMEKYVSRLGSTLVLNTLISLDWCKYKNLIKAENTNKKIYTLWISKCIATAREKIPGSIANYVTRVSECSQQRGNLKDNGYR